MGTIETLKTLAGSEPVKNVSLIGAAYCFAYYKIGDQEVPEDKQKFGFLEGDLVEVVDPNEQKPEAPMSYTLSDDMHRIYYVTRIPLPKKDEMRGYAKPTGGEESGDYKLRQKSIDFDAIAERRGVAKGELMAYLRGEAVVAEEQFTEEESIPLKDRVERSASIKDINAWTGGNVTIGSGGTYATHVAMAADLGTFTSNGIATVISDVSESSVFTLNNIISDFTIEFDGGDFQIAIANSNFGFSLGFSGTSVDSKCVIHDYKIVRTVAGANNNVSMILVNSSTSSYDVHIYNCYLDNGGFSGSLIRAGDANAKLSIWQVIAHNAAGNGASIEGAATDSVIENVSVLSCANGFIHSATAGRVTFRNLASFDNVTDDYRIITSPALFTKCASSDATGSEASLRNLVATNVFQSTTSTDANFLLPVDGGALQDAATATLWITDIGGNPNTGYIGAKQVVAATGGATGTGRSPIIRVLNGEILFNGVASPSPNVLYISPEGGLTVTPNGAPVAQISLSGSNILINGVTIPSGSLLFRGFDGGVQTTPNGLPIGQVL